MAFKKRLMIVIGINLLIVVLFIIGIIFVGSDIEKRAAQIALARGAISSQSELTQTLASLKQDANEAAQYSKILDAIFPKRDNLLAFPGDLKQIVANDSAIADVNIGEESKLNDKVTLLSFTIAIRGTLNNVIKAYHDIQNSKYFFQLNGANLVRTADATDNFQLNTSGKVYSYTK